MSILIPPSSTSIPRVASEATLRSIQRAQPALHAADELRTTPAIPAIVIVVVAVASFLALALVIGAIAAYIWYCQANGLGWPGLQVPGASGGVYKLACFK